MCSKLGSCFPHLPVPRQDLGLRATDSSLSPWEPQRDLKLMLVATGSWVTRDRETFRRRENSELTSPPGRKAVAGLKL